jgi:hypothetical protein
VTKPQSLLQWAIINTGQSICQSVIYTTTYSTHIVMALFQNDNRQDLLYCLLPAPITQHEVPELVYSPVIILPYQCIVEFVFEVKIREDVMNEGSRVMEPNFIFGSHPRWHFAIWLCAVVLGTEALPCHITKGGCVDGTVHVDMTCKGWSIIMNCQ